MTYKTRHPILVVDDEAPIAEALGVLFDGVFRPKFVENSEVAVECLRKNHYPVALVDISLPGKDGVELLRFIRRNFPMTEVVMLTADVTLESALDCIAIGAYAYLTKPWRNRELLLVLQKAIERSELTRTVRVLQKRLDADLERTGNTRNKKGRLQKKDISDFSNHIYQTLDSSHGGSFNDAIEAIEEQTILAAMKANQWNQSRAAEALRIHRNTLIKKMKKFKIPTVPQPTY